MYNKYFDLPLNIMHYDSNSATPEKIFFSSSSFLLHFGLKLISYVPQPLSSLTSYVIPFLLCHTHPATLTPFLFFEQAWLLPTLESLHASSFKVIFLVTSA